jgi:transposase
MYGALRKLMIKEYPSNLTRDQFDLFSDLRPPAQPGGRPRTVDVYVVLNAILYVLVEGVRWRALPGDFPPWQTVYTYFRNWRQDGTWQRIHDRLREWYRIEQGRQMSPSETVIDRLQNHPNFGTRMTSTSAPK